MRISSTSWARLSRRRIGAGIKIRLAFRVTLLAILSLVSAASFAQTCSVSQLRVFVQDRSGVPISDAKVWLADNSEAGAQTTDAEGAANFSNPSCGNVVVHASSDGFQQLAKSFQITDAGPAEVTLIMAPATVQENLEVRATTPLIEASSSATAVACIECAPLPNWWFFSRFFVVENKISA